MEAFPVKVTRLGADRNVHRGLDTEKPGNGNVTRGTWRGAGLTRGWLQQGVCPV